LEKAMHEEAQDPRQTRLEAAGAWCMRMAEGPLPPDEQRRFDDWIAEDPQNLAALEDAVAVWQRFGEVANAPEFVDVRERALASYRRRNQIRWRTGGMNRLKLGAIAASLLLLAGLGALWWHSLPQIYRTSVGERSIVMLDDGSRLSLDAETEVDAKMQKDRRILRLVKGRARFDVAKDPFRPFSVSAGDQVVVATGTSFSVELLRNQMHVVLFEGHVAVLNAAGDQRPASLLLRKTASDPDKSIVADTQLEPGRELISDPDGETAVVHPADLDRAQVWERGQLAFVDEPLGSAIERVNRYSPRKLAIEDASVAALTVNGVFNAGDVDAFLVGVTATLPVRAVPTESTTVLASSHSEHVHKSEVKAK
jgi:transmembrane sensor